ncbi:hypothetical protein RUND412_007959 [Rhizina undulata]
MGNTNEDTCAAAESASPTSSLEPDIIPCPCSRKSFSVLSFAPPQELCSRCLLPARCSNDGQQCLAHELEQLLCKVECIPSEGLTSYMVENHSFFLRLRINLRLLQSEADLNKQFANLGIGEGKLDEELQVSSRLLLALMGKWVAKMPTDGWAILRRKGLL